VALLPQGLFVRLIERTRYQLAAFAMQLCQLFAAMAAGVAGVADPGAPVTDEYRPPFAFAGKIHAVTIDVRCELISDDEAALRAVTARQ
jgi:hypothetical protein